MDSLSLIDSRLSSSPLSMHFTQAWFYQFRMGFWVRFICFRESVISLRWHGSRLSVVVEKNRDTYFSECVVNRTIRVNYRCQINDNTWSWINDNEVQCLGEDIISLPISNANRKNKPSCQKSNRKLYASSGIFDNNSHTFEWNCARFFHLIWSQPTNSVVYFWDGTNNNAFAIFNRQQRWKRFGTISPRFS